MRNVASVRKDCVCVCVCLCARSDTPDYQLEQTESSTESDTGDIVRKERASVTAVRSFLVRLRLNRPNFLQPPQYLISNVD